MSRFPPWVAPTFGIAALSAVLLVRLVPDVRGKPIFEDESLAGLVSSQPLPDVLRTSILDRGGAPLHFVLAHLALALQPSPTGLRLLSVVFAVATLPLLFDLGRRLAGSLAGLATATCGATSELLGIYGSFGRMYAVFIFAAALSIDLFVRALQERTPASAQAAALAAWLLPAVHPFGIVLLWAEAVTAVWVWRFRSFRAAVPVLVIGLALVPFLLADLRLAERYSAGLVGDSSLVTPYRAAAALGRALGGFAGGREPIFLLFVVLAAVGAITLRRRDRGWFLGLTALALLTLPVVLVLVRSQQGYSDHLAARQFAFALPLWSALVGVGVARVATLTRSGVARGAILTAFGVLALLTPSSVPDPRSAQSGTREGVAAPSTWLRRRLIPGSILFPSAPVFLAALPESGRAHSLPREQPALVSRALARTPFPVPAVVVAVPLDGAGVVDARALRRLAGTRSVVKAFPSWLLVSVPGPFREEPNVLLAISRVLDGVRASVAPRSAALDGYLRQGRAAVCGSLRSHGGRCK